jgi:hypothetical protein
MAHLPAHPHFGRIFLAIIISEHWFIAKTFDVVDSSVSQRKNS